MEKIKINLVKFYSVFITCSFFLFLIFYPSKNLKDFIIIVSITMLLLVVVEISNYLNSNGLYFSEEGIIHKYFKNNNLIKWNDIKIEVKIKYKYIYLINIRMNHLKRGYFRLILFWPTEADIIDKTKKYCPKEHNLYKLIEEYTKERNLPF